MNAADHRAAIPPAERKPRPIHATAILVGESGIVIRGRSGAGKSSLALALLDLARLQGVFARLIGDDRIFVGAVNGRVMVEGHPAIAGKIERRGSGIRDVPHETRAVVRLVIDLLDVDPSCGIPPRLPDATDRRIAIDATEVPRLALPAGVPPAQLAAQVLSELPSTPASG
jgi:serine kinase of HPr protein (carbohydrate metabolism regulator)